MGRGRGTITSEEALMALIGATNRKHAPTDLDPAETTDLDPAETMVSETSERQDSLPRSDAAEGPTNTTAPKRLSVAETPGRNVDKICLAQSRSASLPAASVSTRPRTSSRSAGHASSSVARSTHSIGDVSPEGKVHSSCGSKVDSLTAGPSERAVEISDELKELPGHSEASGSTEGGGDALGPSPAPKKVQDTAGTIQEGTIQGGKRVCAADLEAASKEGERLACLAAKACERLDEEEASLLR